MKIYLYLPDKILNFSLPKEILGSFSFDEDPNEESKLINIEAQNSSWVIYSTVDSQVIVNNSPIRSANLQANSFYIIQRNNKQYLVYVSELFESNIALYSYDQALDLIIGNDSNSNIYYNCELINGAISHIHYDNNQLVLERNSNIPIYINNKAVLSQRYIIVYGDTLNIYGLKIMFLNNLLLMNNPSNKITITCPQIKAYLVPNAEPAKNIEIKDVDLYKKEDYFSKSPRIRRIIETKEINLSPPPSSQNSEELPLILTIGPMLTMGITSATTMISTISRINSHETTIQEQWPSLITAGAMLISTLLWPLLTRIYNKKVQKRKKQELITKYGLYLQEKKKELAKEQQLQKDILIENLISTEECLKIIQKRNLNFWDKRLDQSDFLIVRVGFGRELLDVKVEYPEEGFTIEEDDLRKQADAMVEEYKYIEDVPVGYSLHDNKVTAIMGPKNKSFSFMDNIILQLITFYSYEDLKLVIFTDEENKNHWEYIKYLNHNFSNDKNIRFFSTTPDTAKNIAEFLNVEVNNRKQIKEADLKKPYYIIIVDNYSQIKKYSFVKDITETDNNIGFSLLILEERLSKLPSKCNNFITIGSGKSGILKNSYEKQEQITFQDEINSNINMMDIAKILSNIPIEFESGIKSLPDAITFLEMEKVGKVEQLNILNRWNTNDSTRSLKAEIGVDEDGDFMYLDLHEKYHGPHGLIAGTTGSGKSEFIITYILSMAINYSPDDVAFILIDYKGGGLALAFENKKTGISLPHLAGTITNLDKAEMDRTLVSIDSEVKRRQRMFNEARDDLGESTIDIYKYQSFFKEGKVKEPIPHLFIICDEFAELKSQQPDFMDNLISVARIGRSLGVHLILATQKPSGVVNDQIWSNTKFRVCLKVQDESDSKEMLKRPEAASIKQAGRFYLQVGYDEYFALGQSGWCGAKYYPSEKIVKQVDKSINFINDCGTFIKNIKAAGGMKIQAQGDQLSAIMKSIIEVSNKENKKTRKLWLENIPQTILISDIERRYNINSKPFEVQVILGEYDAPEKQEQGIVLYDYIKDGNTIVYGTDGSEREMFLNTLIYATAKNHTAEEINFYAIDYGSESLRRFKNLPQVGGIVFAGEEEKYKNLLKLVREELQKRKKLFSDYGGEYQNYIKSNNKKLPLIVVIMNNFDSIFESNQSLYDEMPELVRDTERYGIIYILTATAINSVNSKISQNFPNLYAFKLKDSSDYRTLFNVRSKTEPRDMIGRGILKHDTIHEFQTASITETEEELNDYLLNFINEQITRNPIKAIKIPVLPDFVRYEDVKAEISTLNKVPVGINKQDLSVCTLDCLANIGSIITSTKIANTEKFIKSFISLLYQIPNINIIIIDPLKLLMLENVNNYYNNDLENVLKKLNEFITKLIDTKSEQQGIILIYGINKLITKLNDSTEINTLTQNLKKYEKIGLMIVEDVSKIKNYQFEVWYTNVFSASTEGVYIGKGVTEQNILRISSITRDMTKDIKNDMGYYVSEGSGTSIKLIDFITKEEVDE